MAVSYNILSFLLVSLVLVISSEGSQEECVQRTPCICVFPNGTGIDLSATSGTTFYSAQAYEKTNNDSIIKMNTYKFHPCKDIPTNHTNAPGDTCSQPLSLFREVFEMKKNSSDTFKVERAACEYLGSTSMLEFAKDGSAIIYKNPPSQTIIQITCAQSASKLHVTSEKEDNDLILTFYSDQACLKQIEEPGRSFGSTLLIIFFSFVTFYLVLGVCTKKFLMGATGIEVIPNLSFWTDLPNLVRDGWAFAINGFRLPTRGVGPTTSPDPNSYDSI